MLDRIEWFDLRKAAWLVGVIDFMIGPIGFLTINRLSFNPHLSEEFNFTNIHPEFETGVNKSVIMTALQGLVLNEWVASIIYYPPIFLTFLVGFQLLIALHQRNYCIGKLSLILNYVLLSLLLIMSIVLLANNVHTVAIAPFLIFSLIQCIFIWIVFEYTMYELRNPGIMAQCAGNSRHNLIMPSRFYNQDEDLNL